MGKGYNRLQRSRAGRAVMNLPECTVEELKGLCRILGAPRGRKVKGGNYRGYRKQQLMRDIRRVVGRGTFGDRLERFADAMGIAEGEQDGQASENT